MYRSQSRGFTLIEVVLALVILSVGVLGMLGMAAVGSRWLAEGRWVTMAAAVAEGRLDSLRAAQGSGSSCAQLGPGQHTRGLVSENWTIGGGPLLATVTVVVSHQLTSRFPAETLSTIAECR